MKRIIMITLAALLAACGGGEPAAGPAPIAQCNGTPKAAVVYVGAQAFPELAAVRNACVYSVDAVSVAEVKAEADRAHAESGRLRAYFIATGPGAAWVIGYMNANPGYTDVASLWFAPLTKAENLHGSLVGIALNDTDADACMKQAGVMTQVVPATCRLWPTGGFGPEQRAAALEQLSLNP